MNITKAGLARAGGVPDSADLALIRTYTRGEPAAEDLYVFPVVLCDNDIDRDGERFDDQTLRELAELFPGKTGISDHDWRSENQVARIFRTELAGDPDRRTAAGEPYLALKAWAYMLRTEANAALIADIEGGIRKEVSVGCAVAERRCSVCGALLGSGACAHVPGELYDEGGGVPCHAVLHGAVDAYEWSFVAVPAQRAAGVTKAARPDSPELAGLRKEAALGRRYLAELRGEVKRLALLCGRDLYDALSPTLESLDAERLLGLRDAFRARAAERLSPVTQLPGSDRAVRFDGEAFRV